MLLHKTIYDNEKVNGEHVLLVCQNETDEVNSFDHASLAAQSHMCITVLPAFPCHEKSTIM
jgi:hypothetical protein